MKLWSKTHRVKRGGEEYHRISWPTFDRDPRWEQYKNPEEGWIEPEVSATSLEKEFRNQFPDQVD